MMEQLRSLLSDCSIDTLHEGLHLEYKAAQGSLPGSLWDTLSAFANTAGGMCILGVEEEQGLPTRVSGVSNAHRMVADLHRDIRNPQRISYPVCGPTDISINRVCDRDVILVRVPAAPRTNRPVYSGNNILNTFVRRAEGDHRCRQDEINRFHREASNDSYDFGILPEFSLDDLDPRAVASFRRRLELADPASHLLVLPDEELFEHVGITRRDRSTGISGLTRAGVLVLGTDRAIREIRPSHLIDYRLLPPVGSTDIRYEDRLAWEGNLLQAYDLIMPRLTERLGMPFRLEQGQRIDTKPGEVALREALLNLLIHADYQESAPSVISQSPSGVMFRNPGDSRVPWQELLSGGRSDARNPTIARLFARMGLVERMGSGLSAILHEWKRLGLEPPVIDSGSRSYEFEIELRRSYIFSELERGWLSEFGQSLNPNEQLGLVLALRHQDVDSQRLAEAGELHRADASTALRSLRDKGLLSSEGAGRSTFYVPSSSLLADIAEWGAGDHDEPEKAIGADDLASAGAIDPAEHMHADSGIGVFDEGLSVLRSSLGVSAETLMQLAAEYRRQRYASPEALQEMIIALCSVQPLSIRTITQLLGRRSADHIRVAVRELVKSDRLRMEYPGQPRHPRQRYSVPTDND